MPTNEVLGKSFQVIGLRMKGYGVIEKYGVILKSALPAKWPYRYVSQCSKGATRRYDTFGLHSG